MRDKGFGQRVDLGGNSGGGFFLSFFLYVFRLFDEHDAL